MPAVSTVSDPDATAAFPRRPRPGIVMGLRAGQVALMGSAIVLAIIGLFAGGLVGPVRGLTVGSAATCVLLALAHVDGRPGYLWIVHRAHHGLRAAHRDTVVHRPVTVRGHRARPAERIRQRAGMLPGRTAAITVYEVDQVAYLHHPHQGTVTAVVEVTSPEFLLQDPAERNARVAGWGRVLAAASRTGAVRQVHLLERAIPDDGTELAAYTDTHLSADPHHAHLTQAYRELTGALRGGADRHQAFLALTVDARLARTPARERGPALAKTWQQEYAVIRRLLPAAGLDGARVLGEGALAHVVRTGFAPSSALRLPADVDRTLAESGPVGGVEEWDHLRCDDAFHAVLWVAEWPRAHVAADVLWPLLFPAGVQRTLSLIYKPFTRAQSESAIRAKHSEIIQSSWLKDKLGRVETLADAKELDDVLARESELLAGHAEVGLVGMVTVSAASLEELDASVALVHAAATQASMDLRRVYGQQLQAFTAGALPLGIPVVA
jgi:hypothetical protein